MPFRTITVAWNRPFRLFRHFVQKFRAAVDKGARCCIVEPPEEGPGVPAIIPRRCNVRGSCLGSGHFKHSCCLITILGRHMQLENDQPSSHTRSRAENQLNPLATSLGGSSAHIGRMQSTENADTCASGAFTEPTPRLNREPSALSTHTHTSA